MTLRLMFLIAPLLVAAPPITSKWIRAASPAGMPEALRRVQPDVHSVEVTASEVIVRSAGLSLGYLGQLQVMASPRNGVGELTFRLPLEPRKEVGSHAHVPTDFVGVFVNGVPIPNHFEAASYRGQNLWHYDLVARNDDGTVTAAGRPRTGLEHGAKPGLLEALIANPGKASPLIGFALDGYPIYGPWSNQGPARSSYQLRAIQLRDRLPDGTLLAPGQYGPPVGPDYPIGTFVEDYEYVEGSGNLDRYNGRIVTTADYPDGTYAYFLSSDSRGKLTFPYLLAHEFRGHINRPQQQLDKFAIEGPLETGKANVLRFRFADQTGKAIRHLEFAHDRPVHVLVISQDRRYFDHIHPEVNLDGIWEVHYTFPSSGRFRIYADHTPPGSNQQVDHYDVDIAEPKMEGIRLEARGPIFAGHDVELAFQVVIPIAGWQPYLGAWAHVVIAGEQLESFLHAHPLEAVQTSESHVHLAQSMGPPPNVIRVPAVFPKAGHYKLWLQIQVSDVVKTIPYELEVVEATKPVGTVEIPSGAIRLQVTARGYEPLRLHVPVGRPVTLAVSRDAEATCGSKIVFPKLNLTRDLPANQITLIELPAHDAGEWAFSCGMGMYRGSLVVH